MELNCQIKKLKMIESGKIYGSPMRLKSMYMRRIAPVKIIPCNIEQLQAVDMASAR